MGEICVCKKIFINVGIGWGLIKLYFFSLVEACWIKGEQFVCPHCLHLLCLCLVLAVLQYGDGYHVLSRLTSMASKKVVSHLAEIPTLLMVRFVVAPPQSHGLLVAPGSGGLTNIVSPGTFGSARPAHQVVDHSRSTGTRSLAKKRKSVSWHRRGADKFSKLGSFANKTLAPTVHVSKIWFVVRVGNKLVLVRGTEELHQVGQLPVGHQEGGWGHQNVEHGVGLADCGKCGGKCIG